MFFWYCFCSFWLFSCFVLNHNIIFVALHLVFLLLFLLFLLLGYFVFSLSFCYLSKKISQNFGLYINCLSAIVISAGCAEVLPWNFLLKPCVEVVMENAVKFLVKFCCSSFLRKRSSKPPRNFSRRIHTTFHEMFCSCKCPMSRHFSLCRRLSMTIALDPVVVAVASKLVRKSWLLTQSSEGSVNVRATALVGHEDWHI